MNNVNNEMFFFCLTDFRSYLPRRKPEERASLFRFNQDCMPHLAQELFIELLYPSLGFIYLCFENLFSLTHQTMNFFLIKLPFLLPFGFALTPQKERVNIRLGWELKCVYVWRRGEEGWDGRMHLSNKLFIYSIFDFFYQRKQWQPFADVLQSRCS